MEIKRSNTFYQMHQILETVVWNRATPVIPVILVKYVMIIQVMIECDHYNEFIIYHRCPKDLVIVASPKANIHDKVRKVIRGIRGNIIIVNQSL